MSPTRRSNVNRTTTFVVLALILSHTQVVVQAQKAAVGSLPDAVTSQEIADAVSKAFGAAVDNATGHDTLSDSSARSSGATPASGDMAQSAAAPAAGLKMLDAYQELLNSVQAKDIGDGANLLRLKAAAGKLQDAYAATSGVLGPDATATGLQRFIGVEQLLLQTVGTELGDLGLAAGLLALAAFILVAVAGALGTGAGAVFIAINSQALAAATAARAADSSTASGVEANPTDLSNTRAFAANDTTNGTDSINSTDSTNSTNSSYWWESAWFQNTENAVDAASMNIVNWAFNSSDNNPLDLALGIIDATHLLLSPASTS